MVVLDAVVPRGGRLRGELPQLVHPPPGGNRPMFLAQTPRIEGNGGRKKKASKNPFGHVFETRQSLPAPPPKSMTAPTPPIIPKKWKCILTTCIKSGRQAPSPGPVLAIPDRLGMAKRGLSPPGLGSQTQNEPVNAKNPVNRQPGGSELQYGGTPECFLLTPGLSPPRRRTGFCHASRPLPYAASPQ